MNKPPSISDEKSEKYQKNAKNNVDKHHSNSNKHVNSRSTSSISVALENNDNSSIKEGVSKPGKIFGVDQSFLDAFPDGKESVEFQISMLIDDLFAANTHQSRANKKIIDTGVDYLKKKIKNISTAHKPRSNKNPPSKNGKTTVSKPEQNQKSSHNSQVHYTSEDSISEASDSSSTNTSEDIIHNNGYTDLTLDEVIANIKYVLDFRIKNGHIKSLDLKLMRRLRDGLLLNMKQESGSFPKRFLTEEANSCFFLFGGFIEEVKEFRIAVSEKEPQDLKDALRLHKRFSTENEMMSATIMIRLVISCLGQGHDWSDLVILNKQPSMEPQIKKRMQILDNDNNSIHIQNEVLNLFPPPSLYIDRNIPKLKLMFGVDFDKGLSGENQITEMLDYYGSNELPKAKNKSIISIILEQLSDFMVLLLLVAVVATAIAGEYNSSVVLFVVIVLNTFIGAFEEIKASKALSALESFSVISARVLRDGSISEIDSKNLVPGDIVDLQEGDSIPADLRLIDTSNLNVIETILTGESVPVTKNTKEIRTKSNKIALGDCFGNCFMGTMIVKGRGRGIVVRTGGNTEIGKISNAINSNNTFRKTPLQKRLKNLGIWLVGIAITLCAVVVIAGIAWGHKVSAMFLSGLALAVSVIPEGLVAVTTVTMALAVRRMAKRNAIVKRLVAVEVLGSITCICSDKTGTLTEGRMGVTEIFDSSENSYKCLDPSNLDPNCGQIVASNDSNISEKVTGNLTNGPDLNNMIALKMSLMSCLYCNNSQIKYSDDAWKGIGDPTEVAILSVALKYGKGPEFISQNSGIQTETPSGSFTRLYENPFDSERKRMSVVIGFESSQDEVKVFSKGAPEEILKICKYKISSNGEIIPLTIESAKKAAEECVLMARRGLRVLGLAYKPKSKKDFDELIKSTDDISNLNNNDKIELSKEDEIEKQKEATEKRVRWAESELIFCGLVGLTDPPREGVKKAVSMCQSAGIKIIMITGDHIETASAIAGQLGIQNPQQPDTCRSISGPDLDLLSDEAIQSLIPFPTVFSRVSPDHKLRIVKALQSIGHISAMTGDGVNDAPAVRQADVGIAMGIGGTEITKEAADIVLVDDNFGTIVSAIEEGRRVFDNILKFILYLLSCNTAEIILFLMASIINAELPMRTIMVLWANIIADVPPAMSVGLEPQEKDILLRPPRNPKSGVLSRSTTVLLILQAFFMAVVTFAYYLISLLTNFGTKLSNTVKPSDLMGKPQLVFKSNNLKNVQDPTLEQYLVIAQSFASITIITLQLAQAFLSRSVTRSIFKMGITSNVYMLYAVALSFILLLVGMYTPPIAKWLELTPLNIYAWIMIFAAVVVQVIYVDIIKHFLRKHYEKTSKKINLNNQAGMNPGIENGISLKDEIYSGNDFPGSLDTNKFETDAKPSMDPVTENSIMPGMLPKKPKRDILPKITKSKSYDNHKNGKNASHFKDIDLDGNLEEGLGSSSQRYKNTIHDDNLLSTPGLTAVQTEELHYEQNKVSNWRHRS
ncbi:Calcium-transporting ATPase 1 [Smittium culicis]|uniref:Calcium-transporting ATPase 1 n=1 Tax=Smittium culicis TaxID=133412 RepID=A0A1R1XRS7_9FUNG|nr:Calcium-transporting ATPase 1 [Smittium culicis]